MSDTLKSWSIEKVTRLISGLLKKNQGAANAGKFMKVGSDGNLVPDNVPDPTGKADKVSGATNGNFAGLDANGNLTDSGSKASDFMTRSAVVDLVYPVGSIYMSVTSTSPATLFGGTWAQLKDRFLLGTGDTYSNGNTGGAASVSYTPAGTNSGGAVSNHTLTVDQIPSHNHSFTGSAVNTGNQSAGHTHNITDYYATTTGGTAITVAQLASHQHGGTFWKQISGYGQVTPGSTTDANRTNIANVDANGSGNTHTHSGANTSATRTSTGISANHTHSVTASGSIGNKGGGKAHNHGFTQPTFTGTAATINTMPPYLAVYMWKRTA